MVVDDKLYYFDGGVPTALFISLSSSSYVPMYLPLNKNNNNISSSRNIDEFINRVYYINNDNVKNSVNDKYSSSPLTAMLKEARDQLLYKNPIRLFGTAYENDNNLRLLYVAQGERGNATSKQYDIIMSDKATTCHILALHSSTAAPTNTTSNINSNSSKSTKNNKRGDDVNDDDDDLFSLTHLDGPNYDECIRDMIKDHIDHHSRYQHNNNKNNNDDDGGDDGDDGCNHTTNDDGTTTTRRSTIINIEIHIVGGFNDDDNSSSNITEWLVKLLATIAEEIKYRQRQNQNQSEEVRMIMKTLVVSSSNNQQLLLPKQQQSFNHCHAENRKKMKRSNNSNTNSINIHINKNNNVNNYINSTRVINSPIGRGLGIDLRTGQVFLAKCCTTTTNDNDNDNDDDDDTVTDAVVGPVPVLRSVRLWSRSIGEQRQPRLSIVHTNKDANTFWSSLIINSSLYANNPIIRNDYSLFWVRPFRFLSCYSSFYPDIDHLLGLSNAMLLRYTSTSPDVEEDGFCNDVRSTLRFIKKAGQQQHHSFPCDNNGRCDSSSNTNYTNYVFGNNFDTPMIFAKKVGVHENHSNNKFDNDNITTSNGKQQQWKQLSMLYNTKLN